MTTVQIIVAAIPYTVQALVATILGTFAWWQTAHNAAVAEVRATGARPSLQAALASAPDEALRRRYHTLRAEADRQAVA